MSSITYQAALNDIEAAINSAHSDYDHSGSGCGGCCRKCSFVVAVVALAFAFAMSCMLSSGYHVQEELCKQYSCNWGELPEVCAKKMSHCESDRAPYGTRCYADDKSSCYAASRAVLVATGCAFVVICLATIALLMALSDRNEVTEQSQIVSNANERRLISSKSASCCLSSFVCRLPSRLHSQMTWPLLKLANSSLSVSARCSVAVFPLICAGLCIVVGVLGCVHVLQLVYRRA